MDLYKNGEIFVNAKFSSINSLKDYDCKYLVSGIHSFKDDSDVTGLYELQYERVKANTGGWFKCNEHEYKSEWECDRRIVAIPTTPPIEPVGMEAEGACCSSCFYSIKESNERPCNYCLDYKEYKSISGVVKTLNEMGDRPFYIDTLKQLLKENYSIGKLTEMLNIIVFNWLNSFENKKTENMGNMENFHCMPDSEQPAIKIANEVSPQGMEAEARELYNKFITIDGVGDLVLPHTIAKQCAIIHCELMLKAFGETESSFFINHYTQLIEKIKQL